MTTPIAHFGYRLKTNTGYICEVTGHEITHEQYGDICAILGGAPVSRETPYTMVQMPCISINHLSRDTALHLHTDPGYAGLIAPHDNGFFLTVPGDETQTREPAPDDLKAIYAFMAGRAPHGWFMLDVDGDIQPDLPTYN